MKTVEEYMELPYTIELTPDRDEEGTSGYVAQVRELPGCLSQGETAEEALENVRDAMAGWLSVGSRTEPRSPSRAPTTPTAAGSSYGSLAACTPSSRARRRRMGRA